MKDLKAVRDEIEHKIRNAGFTPLKVEINSLNVNDPDDEEASLCFVDYRAICQDHNGVTYIIASKEKNRLVDGFESAAEDKRGWCRTCNSPVHVASQDYCRACHGPECHEHLRPSKKPEHRGMLCCKGCRQTLWTKILELFGFGDE